LKAKKYRIWYGWSDIGGGDRYEICRVKANNMDDAIKFVVDEILADGVSFWEDGDKENIYMVLDSCFNCDLKQTDKDLCDECENAHYIEINEDNDIPETFKTITGENMFYDLTLPNHLASIINSADEALNEYRLSRRFN